MIGNNDPTDELADMMDMFAEVMEESAPKLAEMQYTMFEELQKAGFTEEQALQILMYQDFDFTE